MGNVPEIKGKRVILRPVPEYNRNDPYSVDFYERYRDWLNSPRVRWGTGDLSKTDYDLEDVISLLSSWRKDERDSSFIIYSKEGYPIGDCNLRPSSLNGEKFSKIRTSGIEVAVMIGDNLACGKGYATEAMKLAMNYAFENLRVSGDSEKPIENIHLCVAWSNLPAVRLYRRLGFEVVGVVDDKRFPIGKEKFRKDFVMILPRKN